MYLAIIYLPLLASLASGFFGRKIGVTGAQLINTTCIMLTTLLAIFTFFEVGFNNIPVSLQLFSWIDSESLNVFWGFNFDSLTVSMLIPVLIVSCLVHLFSIGYMSHDPHNQRFFSYLSLFTFMMVILVTANNYLLMFVGWEGVGICSYLLVSFWFTRIAANQSSMSAFLTNRVGDCFLTIGMFATIWSFGNVDYATVFSLAPYINGNIITVIGVCLLIGAMAKSSQVGLHVWLPQAMEGPTPVSALIHAATMVTAGVYLLMRSSPLIEYSSTVLLLCLWVGAFTTVFSSLIGLFQQDIKKVIAYSTMSQLGMMVIAVGLSSYNIALFHLVNHAFYKALLFLGAGSVIHAVADNQDFRKYGGLKQFLPLTYSVMLIASLSLVAFPFMTGFYSKDLILESAYGKFHYSSIVVYFIATIGAMFTTLYSAKVLYLTFLSNPSGSKVDYKNAHESDIFMSIPLIVLAIFSIFFGYITKDIFIGLGTNFFIDNGLFFHPYREIMIDTEFAVPSLFKLLPLILTISLSVISIVISEFYFKLVTIFKFSRFGYNVFSFFNQRFYIELFYNRYITDVVLKLGGHTTKVLDKGSIELIGPYGLEKGLLNLSRNIASLDTGIVTSYALYILVSFIFYILLPVLTSYCSLVVLLYCLITVTSKSPISNLIKLESSLFKFDGLVLTIAIALLIAVSISCPTKLFLHVLDLHVFLYGLIGGICAILALAIKDFLKGNKPSKLDYFKRFVMAFLSIICIKYAVESGVTNYMLSGFLFTLAVLLYIPLGVLQIVSSICTHQKLYMGPFLYDSEYKIEKGIKKLFVLSSTGSDKGKGRIPIESLLNPTDDTSSTAPRPPITNSSSSYNAGPVSLNPTPVPAVPSSTAGSVGVSAGEGSSAVPDATTRPNTPISTYPLSRLFDLRSANWNNLSAKDKMEGVLNLESEFNKWKEKNPGDTQATLSKMHMQPNPEGPFADKVSVHVYFAYINSKPDTKLYGSVWEKPYLWKGSESYGKPMCGIRWSEAIVNSKLIKQLKENV